MEEREGKAKFWKGVVIGALVTAFFALLTVGLAAGIWIFGRAAGKGQIQSAVTDTSGEKSRKLDTARIGTKLLYMQQLIDQYFLYGEDEDYMESAEDWIYAGFVFSLGDPYAAYYNAEQYESVEEDDAGEYCGIGVQVSQNPYTGVITVANVFGGSPAEEAGMLPGDVIDQVEGVDASSEDLSILISNYIKGEEGTKVSLTVYRESIDDYVEMEVERRIVENPTVKYEMLENRVGYISLSSFESVSISQIKEACDSLEAQGMEKLVVDLRNNPGGLVDAAEEISDYFLPDGMEVVTFKGKGVPDSTYTAKDGHEIDVPIAILVNGQSASASEVFTGALKDNGRAIVVGTQTFGKGISQGIFRMADGSALKLTTAYYYTPSGECIHEIGIAPDVTVELDEGLQNQIEIPKEEDNQLAAAVKALEEGTIQKELAEILHRP